MENKIYLWVEKYRPEKLDEISAQTSVISSLKNAMQNKNIPHLIFFGPSGCGKTSTILALAKELFGKEYNERIIELNASDERGINVTKHFQSLCSHTSTQCYCVLFTDTHIKSPIWHFLHHELQ